MQELHKIRAQITKEWKGKSAREIVSLIRKETEKSKNIFPCANISPAHPR